MKIRQGFVSNSSSSSFCLIGIKLNNEMYTKLRNYPGVEEAKKIFNEVAVRGTYYCELFDEDYEDPEDLWHEFITDYLGFKDETDYGEIAGFDIEDKTIKEISKTAEQFCEVLACMGFEKTVDELKVFSGEECC